MRNFGIPLLPSQIAQRTSARMFQSGRPALGGASDKPSASLGSYAPSDSILIPASPPFERSKLSQALIDIAALGSLALLICSLASAVGIFGYVVYLKFF